ncbi:hypothetical protein EVAR_85499_1 [Eumeta japonica]|uniref:Uncharacterized protein n=1 Tax=Eumeta variegata TaxID=151549 RepID=A0A4C1VBL7_EUMVA|nr:hypothetical protein EVAR_85499_1 [Eumeta japonica]
MITSARGHLQPVRSHRFLASLLGGKGYPTVEDRVDGKGRRSVGHRNSRSLCEMQEVLLPINARIGEHLRIAKGRFRARIYGGHDPFEPGLRFTIVIELERVLTEPRICDPLTGWICPCAYSGAVQRMKICPSEFAANDILREYYTHRPFLLLLRVPICVITPLRRFRDELHSGKVSCVVLYRIYLGWRRQLLLPYLPGNMQIYKCIYERSATDRLVMNTPKP